MIALIEEVRKDQDSIGGVCELVATGVPPGLGEPVFDKLKADLAKALLSLPAVIGVRVRRRLRRRDDARQREQRCVRASTPSPGLAPKAEGRSEPLSPWARGWGGVCADRHRDEPPRRHARRHLVSGQPIVCRVAIKPTSSLPQPQRTVTRAGEPTEIGKGRHDPCLLPRFVPMGEAMMALVLVDHLLRGRANRLSG